jgi:hypothetical protein
VSALCMLYKPNYLFCLDPQRSGISMVLAQLRPPVVLLSGHLWYWLSESGREVQTTRVHPKAASDFSRQQSSAF